MTGYANVVYLFALGKQTNSITNSNDSISMCVLFVLFYYHLSTLRSINIARVHVQITDQLLLHGIDVRPHRRSALQSINSAMMDEPDGLTRWTNKVVTFFFSKMRPHSFATRKSIREQHAYSVKYVCRVWEHKSTDKCPEAISGWTRAFELICDGVAFDDIYYTICGDVRIFTHIHVKLMCYRGLWLESAMRIGRMTCVSVQKNVQYSLWLLLANQQVDSIWILHFVYLSKLLFDCIILFNSRTYDQKRLAYISVSCNDVVFLFSVENVDDMWA